MLSRTFGKIVLQVGSALCLIWGAISIFRIITTPVYQGNDTSRQFIYLIQMSYTLALSLIIHQGNLLFIAVAVLLLAFSSRRVKASYWSIQVAIWLIGITLWYQTPSLPNPLPENPFWIGVTVLCSLILLALYIPSMVVLTKILKPREIVSKRQ